MAQRYKVKSRETPMITALVQFQLPANITADRAKELFRASAPKYRGVAGLLRKYYVYHAESHTGGGCYLWESRAAAETFYNDVWRKMITDNYGAPPQLTLFETPVIVDNVIGATQLDAAE
jgi:hypothetical protein